MKAVIDRGQGAAGIRLLQAGYHMRSMSLYASLGFEVREPIVVMSGRPKSAPVPGVVARRMVASDVAACDALCRRVHGISRANEIADAVRLFAPVVIERGRRITGYLTNPALWLMNHGVAESEDDMTALLLGAAGLQAEPLSFLLPTRQSALFRWCLAEEVGHAHDADDDGRIPDADGDLCAVGAVLRGRGRDVCDDAAHTGAFLLPGKLE
jgi:hypothetical protein